MKKIFFPLKYTIPLIFCLLVFVIGSYDLLQQIRVENQLVEQKITEEAKFLGSKTSSLLEFLYRNAPEDRADLEGAKLVVSETGGNPNLEFAVLLNTYDRVILSTRYDWQHLHLKDVLSERQGHGYSDFFERKKTLTGQIEISENRNNLWAFYPIRLPPKVGELRSSQIGVLIFKYDLSTPKRRIWQSVVHRSFRNVSLLIGLSFISWLFFKQTITVRANHLVRVANSRRKGDLSIRSQLQGNDELAQISTAFNLMADELQKETEELIKTNQQLEQEISQRQQTEQALQKLNSELEMRIRDRTVELAEREARYKGLLNAAVDTILIADSEGYILEGNPQAEKLFGYSQNELVQKHFTQLHPPEEFDTIQRGFGGLTVETLILCKDGSLKPVEISSSVFVVNGKTLVQGIFRDISERKQTERERQNILQELAGFKLALDQTAIVAMTNTEGEITYVNQKFVEISGYSETELLGQTHHILQSGTHFPSFYQHLWDNISQGKVWREEICNRSKDGSFFWIDTNIVPFFDAQNKPERYLSIGLDITKQKKSLLEKEILLKEIHHRVKNNLYVISSLLNIQQSYFDDDEVVKAFTNSQKRIQSMAIIHEKLYQSKNISEVDFGNYITELVNSLFNTYNPYPETIKCLICVEPIQLNIETAVPCGLIVNEIITNALKHAFNITHQGSIKIELFCEQQNIHLIIRDNGKGLEPDFKLENSKSLGLKLINILVEQLDAKLTIKTGLNEGTSYYFIFSEVLK